MFNQAPALGGQSPTPCSTFSNPEPQSPFESIGEIGNTLLNIVKSIQVNSAAISDTLGGAPPSPANSTKPAEPSNVCDLLRVLRERLTDADCDLARSRKLLGV